ncbi:MAG TPA: DUF3027 domain-containing protein [Mycobacteriales bacterium]|nr:DUF3027 domain-containing protein [Mycobacteriales bacterium]
MTTSVMTEPTARRAAPDSVCAAAVELARTAALDEVGTPSLGDHVGVEADGERIATHLFECRDPGYVGWRWGVQVVRASRAREATVNDVFRVPGPDALVAPPWVPWAERLRPGDLGVGDLLPAAPDDDRLALALEDALSDAPLIEWGLGRPRVLSYVGRVEAAERWYDGDAGPQSPHARQAPAHCVTCGFFVPFAGGLGFGFGGCANEFSPDDGRVVAVDHGCGAHSEGSALVAEIGPPPALVDEFTFEVVVDPVDDPVDDVASPHDAAADYITAADVESDPGRVES